MGSAYVALAQASGRILLDSDAVDATYRAGVLHLDISPLSDCAGLRLRWQRSAAVVVKALTGNPFSDWRDGGALPPTSPPPPLTGAALYAAIGLDEQFDAAAMPAGTTSTAAGHIVIPAAQDFDGDGTDDAAFIAFAIRSDLAPGGLSDIRQIGSAFNSRIAFMPAVADADVTLAIDETTYQLYVSRQPWRAELLGGEWSLR